MRLRALLVALCLLLFPAAPAWAATQVAVLAGGCFWCLEHDLEVLPGVIDVQSGYSGGTTQRPTYKQVSAGGTGHQEVVRVHFDDTRLPHDTLLRAYWRNVDPLDGGGQFCDRGSSYRPVIFTTTEGQAAAARRSRAAAARELGVPVERLEVRIQPLDRFWPAETYHQDYAQRNPVRYKVYRWNCGRDARLDAVWGKTARSSRPWREP